MTQAPSSDTLAPPLPALAWSDELLLDQPQMDRTHRDFVTLLADARGALVEGDVTGGLRAFGRLVEHTVEHFAQEDRWMQSCGFDAENCHSRQHAMVLQVMREVLRVARDEGRLEPLHLAVGELAAWFPMHARMMDAGLAQQMAAVGFDPLTERATGTLPAVPLTHCGSGSGCG